MKKNVDRRCLSMKTVAIYLFCYNSTALTSKLYSKLAVKACSLTRSRQKLAR